MKLLTPTTLPTNRRKELEKEKKRKDKSRRKKQRRKRTEERKTAGMSELKDPAIKLFGKTISLPQNELVSVSVHADRNPGLQSSPNAAVSEDAKVFSIYVLYAYRIWQA